LKSHQLQREKLDKNHKYATL